MKRNSKNIKQEECEKELATLNPYVKRDRLRTKPHVTLVHAEAVLCVECILKHFECAACCVCSGRKNDSDVDTTMEEEAFSKV